MKKNHFLVKLNFLMFMLAFAWFSMPVVFAQLPASFESSLDEYYTEIVKVYKIIESEDVEVPLRKIDDLKPSIEQKAKKVASSADALPDLLEYLDSDEFLQDFQSKPYFIELMRITQSEAFSAKFMGNAMLQAKVEEVENIIEAYVDSDEDSEDESEELTTGVAFSIQ